MGRAVICRSSGVWKAPFRAQPTPNACKNLWAMRRFGLGVLTHVVALAAPAVPAMGAADVVVQAVEVGRSAERAGLRPGDRLLGWKGPGGAESVATADHRPLESPLDVWLLELRQTEVEVMAVRPSGDFVAQLRPGKWGLETRPVLEEPVLSKYRQATDLLDQGMFDAGTERLQRLALSLGQGDPDQACWLLQDAGERLARAARWDESAQLYSQAAGIAASSGRVGLEAHLRYVQGKVLFEAQRYDESEVALRIATEKWQQIAPRGLAVAETIAARGYLALEVGKLEAAETLFSESLAIRKERPDASLALAESLHGLATIAMKRGDLRAAERLLGRGSGGSGGEGARRARDRRHAQRLGRGRVASQQLRRSRRPCQESFFNGGETGA